MSFWRGSDAEPACLGTHLCTYWARRGRAGLNAREGGLKWTIEWSILSREKVHMRISVTDAKAQLTDLVRRDDFKPLMNTAIATIRGLRLLRAVTSERQLRERWPAARDQLLASQPAG